MKLRAWKITAAVALLMASAAVLLSAWLFARSSDALNQIRREGVERRDQICEQAEREYARAVRSLENTYAYLDGLPRAEWRDSLTRTVIEQLPQAERRARRDQAPAFCDEPGIGLPEPDPVPPKRRDFRFMLR